MLTSRRIMLLFYKMLHRAFTGTMLKQPYTLSSVITKNQILVNCNISTSQHLNFVVTSNCMNHDTIAVHLFQRKLISFLKHALSSFPTKIAYFSDGAASQYKNRKNFINLIMQSPSGLWCTGRMALLSNFTRKGCM